jgi:Xaa-Pro dipeptidase
MSTDAALYAAHLRELMQRADQALEASGHEHLLIAAGVEKYQFLDDRPYPFAINPHFAHWLPLTQHAGSWLAYTPGRRPLLVYYQPEDFWHVAPADPAGVWVAHVDIRIVRQPEDAARHLPPAERAAIVGEPDAALPGYMPNNPQALLDRLHWQRSFKTGWELSRMRVAQRRAVPGHRAAEAAFRAGESEAGIHRAYLAATGHRDADLPYGNIIGLNEHGAILHYQVQETRAPARARSLLIDAGASVDGYAADITRTYGDGDAEFEALIAAVDRVQQDLCAKVRPGQGYPALHIEAHHRLAGVLKDLGIVDMPPDAMVENGVSSVFFPHGLGHPIGLQVHDVAGFQAGPEGGRIERPAGHPFLRLTRELQPGMVVTIEPGIYFIDSLLAGLRAGPHAQTVDWQRIEHLRAFGGVRIEDEVHCTEDEAENLTRDAFAEAA